MWPHSRASGPRCAVNAVMSGMENCKEDLQVHNETPHSTLYGLVLSFCRPPAPLERKANYFLT